MGVPIRGVQVMLDKDIAQLYGTETRRVNEQVKRNIERFSVEFMFQHKESEFKDWKSYFAMSNSDKMGLYNPVRNSITNFLDKYLLKNLEWCSIEFYLNCDKIMSLGD